MKIVFAGSPEFAVPALNALLNAGKNVIAVITQGTSLWAESKF